SAGPSTATIPTVTSPAPAQTAVGVRGAPRASAHPAGIAEARCATNSPTVPNGAAARPPERRSPPPSQDKRRPGSAAEAATPRTVRHLLEPATPVSPPPSNRCCRRLGAEGPRGLGPAELPDQAVEGVVHHRPPEVQPLPDL